jgi:serine phosphatase RsbU (regulator of sigma subunit)
MVIKGSCPGQLVELLGERNVMGRHPSCQIVLDNAAVSRNHAQILESHGTYYLEDLRSRNGTLLNGKKIQGRVEMTDRDEIRVCEVVLRFFQGMPDDSDKTSLPVRNPLDTPQSPPLATAQQQLKTVSDTGAIAFAAATNATCDDLGSDSSSIITSLDVKNRGPRIVVRPEAKLRAVMEISQNLARSLNTEEVLPRILESLFKIFPQADRGFVVLKDPSTGELQVKSQRTRREEQTDSVRLSMTILMAAMDKGRAILSEDAGTDQRFILSDSVTALRIRSVMCAPLVAQSGESLGAIQIDSVDNSMPFSEDDLEVLVSVAAQAALSLENAQLHASVLKQRDYERDLEFASQVQLGFLPNERPHLAGYEFFDFYEAAQRVGGDFFDYVVLPDGRVAIFIGDVAGKGMPAALLMARIYADTRYELLAKPTPAEALTSLNAGVSSSGLGHRFITLAIVVLDPKAHMLTVVNAGHLAPLLRAPARSDLPGADSSSRDLPVAPAADPNVPRPTSSQTCAALPVRPIGTDVSGLPLGIQNQTVYKQTAVPFPPGAALVLVTDGVTEAMNPSHEIYGTPRLSTFLAHAPASADGLGEAIVADIESFASGEAQRDDVCVICIHRLSS